MADDDRGAITHERIELLREKIMRRRILGYRDMPVKLTQMERLLELAEKALKMRT